MSSEKSVKYYLENIIYQLYLDLNRNPLDNNYQVLDIREAIKDSTEDLNILKKIVDHVIRYNDTIKALKTIDDILYITIQEKKRVSPEALLRALSYIEKESNFTNNNLSFTLEKYLIGIPKLSDSIGPSHTDTPISQLRYDGSIVG